MDRIEFENKLLVRGGELGRWPVAEADAARRLLAGDAECRALLAEIQAGDEALRNLTSAPLDAALIGRIMAATQSPPARHRLTRGWRPMVPAGVLAVLVVAGAGFTSGYDDGYGTAQELDLVSAVTGELHDLEDLP